MKRDAAAAMEHYRQVAAGGDDRSAVDLGLAIAGVLAPGEVDIEDCLTDLVGLAEAVGEASLSALTNVLFDDRGFVGNSDAYYSPDNSRLDLVIGRRTGIPLTLSMVTAHVGRTVGLDTMVTNSPGHVLVVVGDMEAWIDPFGGGTILDRAGCESLLTPFSGGRTLDRSFLGPATSTTVAQRMLNNLRGIYQASADRPMLIRVEQLAAMLTTTPVEQSMRVAKLLAESGDLGGAADVLEIASERHAEPDVLRHRAIALRAKLN